MRNKFLNLIIPVAVALVSCERDDELYDFSGGGETGIDNIIRFSPLNDSTADADTASILVARAQV
jgi:hypothetical protein